MIHKDSVFIYPQPNDIFDVLISSKQRFNDWELRRFALERGILVSEHMDREALCLRIASLPFDHALLNKLEEILKVESRRSKVSSQRLQGTLGTDELQTAINKLKQQNPREQIDLNITRNGKATLKIHYNEVDHAVTRLKQRKPKQATVELETQGESNTNIRYQASERVEEIVTSLLSILDEKEAKSRINIDLSTLTPTQTNQFFLELVNSIPGLPFNHTLKVGIQKVQNHATDDDSDEEDDLSNSLVAEINKAMVSGHNPLQTTAVQALLDSGEYYIHTIRWETGRVTLTDGGTAFDGHVLLEIKGYPIASMQRLAYETVNVRRYSAERDRLYSTPEPLPTLQSKLYIKMLEDAAYQCFERVRDNQCATSGLMQSGA